MDAIDNFCKAVDGIYGVYLDANKGFKLWGQQLTAMQVEWKSSIGKGIEDLDKIPFVYARQNETFPESLGFHTAEVGTLKGRNRQNGENSYFLGAMCVVAIYQFWEDRFRAEIAKGLGKEKNELKHDLFGDIRLFRHAILHCGGVINADTAKCKLLKWFGDGDRIVIDEDRIHHLILNVIRVCKDMR